MSCSKTSYSTEKFALEDLKKFQKSKGVYLCNSCNTWHLTSDNGVLFEKIKELRQSLSKAYLEKQKLAEEVVALKSVLKDIKLNYQPIKTKIHNGSNKGYKRNGR